MVKMVSLKKTAGEQKADDEAMGEPMARGSDGIDIHLDHHHLKKIGMEELPEIGSTHHAAVRMHVHEKHESDNTNPRLTMRITHMGMEPDSEDKDEDSTAKDADKEPGRGTLRGDIARITRESEAKQVEKEKLRAGRKGKQEPEKAEGK